MAVLLRKDTGSDRIFAYCSISGNSGVVKEIRACQVRHGTPLDNVVDARGAADGPSTGFVESGTPGIAPSCSAFYAAYIGYAFNGGTTTTGRTDFVFAC